MRRRISIDPDGAGLDDVTGRVYLFEDDPPRHPALYDEAVWARYLAAYEAFSLAKTAVCAVLHEEPYDQVELELAGKAKAIMDGDYDPDVMDQLEDAAIEHAKAFTEPA